MDVHIEQAGYERGESVIEDIEFEVRPGEIVRRSPVSPEQSRGCVER